MESVLRFHANTWLSGSTLPVRRTRPAVSVLVTKGSLGGGKGNVGDRQPTTKSAVPRSQLRRERRNIATQGSMQHARGTEFIKRLKLLLFIVQARACDRLRPPLRRKLGCGS